jgi:hypothetical protein
MHARNAHGEMHAFGEIRACGFVAVEPDLGAGAGRSAEGARPRKRIYGDLGSSVSYSRMSSGGSP